MQSTPENPEHIAEGPLRGRPPGKRNRSLVQRQADREQITQEHLRNVPVAQIAAKLGLSKRTVTAEITAISRGWSESAPRAFRTAVGKYVPKLVEIERQAFSGLEKESGTWVTSTTTVTQTEKGPITKTIKRPISDTRLIRLLRTLARCVEQRTKGAGFR